eukprot:3705691-Pleurochrysis_carterae.AAC.5
MSVIVSQACHLTSRLQSAVSHISPGFPCGCEVGYWHDRHAQSAATACQRCPNGTFSLGDARSVLECLPCSRSLGVPCDFVTNEHLEFFLALIVGLAAGFYSMYWFVQKDSAQNLMRDGGGLSRATLPFDLLSHLTATFAFCVPGCTFLFAGAPTESTCQAQLLLPSLALTLTLAGFLAQGLLTASVLVHWERARTELELRAGRVPNFTDACDTLVRDYHRSTALILMVCTAPHMRCALVFVDAEGGLVREAGAARTCSGLQTGGTAAYESRLRRSLKGGDAWRADFGNGRTARRPFERARTFVAARPAATTPLRERVAGADARLLPRRLELAAVGAAPQIPCARMTPARCARTPP